MVDSNSSTIWVLRGETIMDYSIYDAFGAGFNKIVFIIRRSFEKEFREKFVDKLRGKAEIKLAFQELDNISG